MGVASELSERLAGEGLSATRWGNEPFYHYVEHRHDYDKVLVATAGSIVFHLPDAQSDIELRSGDRLELPADTLHGADVGALGVTCLEAHLDAGSLGLEPRHIAGWGLSDQ